MNLVLKKISIALLLFAGMASAFANPGQREERAAARAERQQQNARDAQDDQQQQMLRDAESRRAQDARTNERRPYVQPNMQPNLQQQGGPSAAPEGARRNARMSPEERRALRRQIDEAGHQIYAPQQR